MNDYKKYSVFILFMGIVTTALSGQDQDFIIKPIKTKKLSVNVLKENIGQATKTLFQTTTLLNKNLGSLQLDIAQAQVVFNNKENHTFATAVLEQSTKITKIFGTIQIDIASLQDTFSNIIEKLVENQAPFKKASRQELETALTAIQTVDKELVVSIDTCKKMSASLRKQKPTKLITTVSGNTVMNSLKDIEKKLEQHGTVVKNAHLSMAKNVCLK